MRQPALLGVVAIAFSPIACTQPDHPPTPGAALMLPDEIEASKVVVETSGAWTIRKASRALGDSPSPTASRFAGDASGRAASEGVERGVDLELAESLESIDDDGVVPPPTAPGGDLAKRKAPGKPDASSVANRAPLRAGSTDDNVDFEKYLDFLATQRENQSLSGKYADLDVSDRRAIRVLSPTGVPVPAAEILILDQRRDVVAWRGTTYGDGRIPFYPALHPSNEIAETDASEPRFMVQVRISDMVHRFPWDGADRELVLTLPGGAPTIGEVELDVLFLIDTTGSMGDEIAQIKSTLLTVTTKLRSLEREFDLRYAAVLYRDLGDAYITKAHPFTSDIAAFDTALREVQAQGGGDSPESLNQGLAVAISDSGWRRQAAKVVFLIADAAPHMDYEGDLPYPDSLRSAVEQGIRVHSVAASGLDLAGTVAFRQISQFTRGKFIFIEYGSTSASAAKHSVTGKVESNNLADILYGQIRDEVAKWGRN